MGTHFLTSRRVKLTAAGAVAVLGLSGLGAVAAFAASGGSLTAPAFPAAKQAAPATTPNRLAAAKDRVNLSVDRGQSGLDRLVTSAAGDPSLSAGQKTTVTSDVAAARAALSALKAKVDAETTLKAIRADVRSARAAATSDPAVEQADLLARGYADTAILNRVDAAVTRLQTKVHNAPTTGHDVTKVQSALTDLQAKAADARSQLAGFAPAVLSGQSGAAKVAAGLKAARPDLVAIRVDVKAIRLGIK